MNSSLSTQLVRCGILEKRVIVRIHAKDFQRQHDRFEYGPVAWGLETVRVGIHFLDPMECPWIESVNTNLHPLSIGEEEA